MSGAPVALYALSERAVLQVRGADRVRWLDGMLSSDIAALAPLRAQPTLALTHQGRIVADGFVLALEDALWFELEHPALPLARAHLERFIIADDVALSEARAVPAPTGDADASDAPTADAGLARFSVDGAEAARVLADCLGAPAPGAWEIARAEFAGAALLLAGYGFTGVPAVQVFAPAAPARAFADALCAAGGARLAVGDARDFECRRIEAGTPRFGHELDDSVLPAEARLDAAISETKGCYTGQEVVARMRSRGRVGHQLVGLRFASAPPAPGAALATGGAVVGEVTSAVQSPRCGAIGLGFVKTAHAAPGTALAAADARAEVVPLPHAPL